MDTCMCVCVRPTDRWTLDIAHKFHCKMRLQSSAAPAAAEIATITKQTACKLEIRKDNNKNTKCKQTNKKTKNQLMQRKASPAIYGIIENLFAFAATLMDFACWRRQMDGRGWRQVDERWVPGAPVSFRCPGQHIMFLVPTICIQGLRIFVNLIEFQWKLSRCDGNGDGDSGSNDACGGGSAVLISFCLYLARRQFLSSSVYGNRSYKVSSSSFLGKLWRKRYRYTDTADVELLLLSPSVLNSQHVPMLICFTSSTPPSSTTSCCAAHFLNRPNENVKLTAARDYVTFCTAANATDAAAATANGGCLNWVNNVAMEMLPKQQQQQQQQEEAQSKWNTQNSCP